MKTLKIFFLMCAILIAAPQPAQAGSGEFSSNKIVYPAIAILGTGLGVTLTYFIMHYLHKRAMRRASEEAALQHRLDSIAERHEHDRVVKELKRLRAQVAQGGAPLPKVHQQQAVLPVDQSSILAVDSPVGVHASSAARQEFIRNHFDGSGDQE